MKKQKKVLTEKQLTETQEVLEQIPVIERGMRVSITPQVKRGNRTDSADPRTGTVEYVNRKFKWANVKVDGVGYTESHYFDRLVVIS